MLDSFPHYYQLDQMDCGPTCLRMIAKYYGRHYTSQTLREKSQQNREGVTLLGIAQAAESIGLRSIGTQISVEKLIAEAPLPCILHWGQNHFVVLHKIEGEARPRRLNLFSRVFYGLQNTLQSATRIFRKNDKVSPIRGGQGIRFHIADPGRGRVVYENKEFESQWVSNRNGREERGVVLLVEPTAKFFEEEGEEHDSIGIFGLLSYLLKYKRMLLQLGLGMLFGSGIQLIFPFLTQAIVDVGIATSNYSFIYLILVAQVVLLVSSTAVDFLRSWILLFISTRLNLSILSEFLAKLMRLPVSFFDVKHFGDIMQRIGDHSRIETFLTSQTITILFSIFNLFLFAIALALYDKTIFFVASLSSIVYMAWVLIFLRGRKKIDIKRFDVSSRNQSLLVQLLQGMQDIKLSGAETRYRWNWEKIQIKLFKLNAQSLSLSQVQQGGALFINQGKNIIVTFLTVRGVMNGELSLGQMMSIQYILGQFNSPVEQFVGFLQSWQDARLSIARLNEVHNLQDEEPSSTLFRQSWDRSQDIQLSNVSFTYSGAGNEPVLKDINLLIKRGKVTAIVGTSGSGKTTLLKLILRYYEPQEGQIYLTKSSDDSSRDGLPPWMQDGAVTKLSSISHRLWRQECGVVMQESFIFSETIARNIAVGDEYIDSDRLIEAARVANIHTFIDSLPLGYHTKIGSEGVGISQGQRQRILIARSVYKDPNLILFDEATNSLDANNESTIMKNLEIFFTGRTVVIAAHRLSTVKNADQIVVLEKGNIVEVGKHAELISMRGRYFELVNNQLETMHL